MLFFQLRRVAHMVVYSMAPKWHNREPLKTCYAPEASQDGTLLHFCHIFTQWRVIQVGASPNFLDYTGT